MNVPQPIRVTTEQYELAVMAFAAFYKRVLSNGLWFCASIVIYEWLSKDGRHPALAIVSLFSCAISGLVVAIFFLLAAMSLVTQFFLHRKLAKLRKLWGLNG